ncbi:Ribonuclease H-like domain containing protein [Parasponia andersonii]|uniref:Ribonuclease H-like domain containing protein n=1 Tax=Parasponia andersonii TaxID=3476 RepID=A0A2P5CJ85_PARAD|nr:Ribonuclease H-like domain containing protein [Parasponia andersonii]
MRLTARALRVISSTPTWMTQLFFKDSWGNISRVVYKFDSALNALDAGLKAIDMALMEPNDLGWKKIVLFSDAKLAVKALSIQNRPPNWRSMGSFLHTLALCSTFVEIFFTFVPMVQNTAADSLAKWTRVNESSSSFCTGEAPPFVVSTLNF